MTITYAELLERLNTMSAEQLAMNVVTYSGDIDDTIRVIGFSLNTDEEMGESMPGFDTTQTFLVLE